MVILQQNRTKSTSNTNKINYSEITINKKTALRLPFLNSSLTFQTLLIINTFELRLLFFRVINLKLVVNRTKI